MAEAMPAFFDGTELVSEWDAGVPASPTPIPMNPNATPIGRNEHPSRQKNSIVMNAARQKA